MIPAQLQQFTATYDHIYWHAPESNRFGPLWRPLTTGFGSAIPVFLFRHRHALSQPGNLKSFRRVLSAPYYITIAIVRGGSVRATPAERRNIFGLYNVSEAARQLGVDIQQLHRDVRAGRVRSPEFLFGRRLYFTAEDLIELSTQYTEGTDR